MKKFILQFFFLQFFLSTAWSANWYVDSAASGAENGTDWSNAWTDPTNIVWGGAGVVAGDTVFISGGDVSKTYSNQWAVGVNGTSGDRISVRIGQDSGHDGHVIFDGSHRGETNDWGYFTACLRNYITIDGNRNGQARITYRNLVHTNSAASCRSIYGEEVTENIIRYINFSNVNNGIRMGMSAGSEVHNCNFYVRGDSALMLTSTNATDYDAVLVYSNTIVSYVKPGGGGPDGIQVCRGLSSYHNNFTCENVAFFTSGQHPDFHQGIDSQYIKIYNNEFVNFWDSGIDLGPFYGSNGLSDIIIFNNIFRITEQMDNVPEFIRFTSADKNGFGFFRNVKIINNLFVDNTNANTSIVLLYNENPNSGGTNNWIANNIWLGCSLNEYNPMIKSYDTNNPSVWHISNNIYNAMIGSVGYVNWQGTSYTAQAWCNTFDPAGVTNEPSFLAYSPLGLSNDFRLSNSDTVAVNRGVSFSDIFDFDRYGNSRSGTWDIGPVELQAIYYVSTNGDNGNPGTAAEPWRTIQHAASNLLAGDSVIILPGLYNETVSSVSGGSGEYSRISFIGSNTPTLKSVTIEHPYIAWEGFRHNKHSGASTADACIKVDNGGDHARILSCIIEDGIYAKSDLVEFQSTNTILFPGGGLLAAGFTNGQTIGVFRGTNVSISNQSTYIISSISDTTIVVTTGNIIDDGPVSAYVTGSYNYGLHLSGGAENCVFISNQFKNLAYSYCFLNGNNHEFSHNTLSTNNGWDLLFFAGTNHIIKQNYFHNCGWGVYEPSADIFDNWPTRYDNIHFTNNYVENVVGVINAQKNNSTLSGPLYIVGNVFIDLGWLSLVMPSTTIENNTFLRTAKTNNAAVSLEIHPIIIGVSDGATNIIIRNNAFVDCGQTTFGYDEQGVGWYKIEGVTNTILREYNFVASAPPGYGSKTNWPESEILNGGDPGLADINDPIGPDGIPFSDDDGLRLLSSSMLRGAGFSGLDIGAYQYVAESAATNAVRQTWSGRQSWGGKIIFQ